MIKVIFFLVVLAIWCVGISMVVASFRLLSFSGSFTEVFTSTLLWAWSFICGLFIIAAGAGLLSSVSDKKDGKP